MDSLLKRIVTLASWTVEILGGVGQADALGVEPSFACSAADLSNVFDFFSELRVSADAEDEVRVIVVVEANYWSYSLLLYVLEKGHRFIFLLF